MTFVKSRGRARRFGLREQHVKCTIPFIIKNHNKYEAIRAQKFLQVNLSDLNFQMESEKMQQPTFPRIFVRRLMLSKEDLVMLLQVGRLSCVDAKLVSAVRDGESTVDLLKVARRS